MRPLPSKPTIKGSRKLPVRFEDTAAESFTLIIQRQRAPSHAREGDIEDFIQGNPLLWMRTDKRKSQTASSVNVPMFLIDSIRR